MKKTLSLILAVMMLLGCMSVTAFAEEPDNTTDITLTVAKALTYDMVIPADVTNLNAAGIYSVGQAKVANVKNATDDTVISYTAETTAFKCEGKTDIPASYYTDEAGQNAFPTTAVEVYKSKADAASIPTMYVGISESAWDAAENGTYTATVTYNFSAEEKQKVTIADILPDNFPTNFETSSWTNTTNTSENYKLYAADGYLMAADAERYFVRVNTGTELTFNNGNYSCAVVGATLTFSVIDNKFVNRACFSYTSMGNPWLVFSDYNGTGDMELQIKLICSTPVTKTSKVRVEMHRPYHFATPFSV